MNGGEISLVRLHTASAIKLSDVLYEKKTENHLAMLTLASIMVWA